MVAPVRTALVLLLAALAVSAPPAAAASPRLVAGAGTKAAEGTALRARVLTGTTRIWVIGVRRPRYAVLRLDRRKPVRLNVRRGALRSWTLDSTRLKDGRHTLNVRVFRRGRKPGRIRTTFRVANHGARTDQLIAKALAQHRIDLGTSLVYRFYAFLGDPRLPSRYQGAPPADDTVGMDARAALTAGKVKGKEAKRLRTFLLRPTDPRSPLYVRPTAAAAAKACSVKDAAPEIGTGDSRLWAWQSKNDTAFGNAYRWVQRDASKALATEERDMGDAAPDGPTDCAAANPTTAVDVYLVNGAAATVRRSGETTGTDADGALVYAVAVPGSCAAGRCAGFVLLNVQATTLRRTFVDTILYHELYHVLEYAHMSAVPRQWPWPTEADATWAQGHYQPGNPDAAAYSKDWYANFQTDSPYRNLGERCDGCEYQYWIWPFFMTQEGASVARSWSAVANAGTDAAVNRALDATFPFADHLRDFAIRDLNLPWHERGGAEGRRFQSGSGGWPAIPELATPRRDAGEVKLQNTDNAKRPFNVITPISLDFETQRFTLPTRDKLRYVAMDFSALGPHFDVDALVHVVGHDGWERRRLPDQTLTFCRDDPGDDIDAIIAVYTDHTLDGEYGHQANMNYRGRTSCDPVVEWRGPWTSRGDTALDGYYETSTVSTASSDWVLDRSNATTSYWPYKMTPTTAQVTVSGHQDGGCSWTGAGTVTVTGRLEVQDPHSDQAFYGLNASTDGAIPVHYTCPLQGGGTESYTEDISNYGNFFSNREPFSTKLTELKGSYDSGATTSPRRRNTWDLTAVKTGDAP